MTNEAIDYLVEPLTGLDVLTKDYVLDVRFIITGLLDSDKLLKGLYDVITQKWPVMGSRIASLPQGRFEMRIPKTFCDSQPPLHFDTYEAAEEVAIADCFNRLPELDALDIKTESDLIAFESFMLTKPQAYKKLKRKIPSSSIGKQCSGLSNGPFVLAKDLIDKDIPLIQTLVHLFPNSNETLVRIILPHCVFDASNIAALFRAWSDSMNGRLDRIPSFLPIFQASKSIQELPEEVLQSCDPKRPPMPKGYRYGDLSQILMMLFMLIWRWIMLPLLRLQVPSMRRAVNIWVPNEILQSWREEARKEALTYGYWHDFFISDNDLCVAWCLERMAKKYDSQLDGNFTLGLAVNVRTRIPQLAQKLGIDLRGPSQSSAMANATSIFAHNGAFLWNSGIFSWKDVSEWPKWSMAIKIREELIRLRQPETADEVSRIMAAMQHCHITPGAPTLLPMNPSTLLCATSNWKQADPIAAIDFSSAVLDTVSKPFHNNWAAKTSPGKASELSMTEKKTENPAPTVAVINVLTDRPGKGVLITVACDGNLIKDHTFGTLVDLSKL
ncbi:uncharacterized protein FA14DRAFT_177423 [Meira miltonrushii]|uniref:Uncharacterized protein n=1 Tax=Meira miltonrushii TaxID=1280837 RepID=A0A316VKR3_9BASI|nr:uncharacterized protein FA14DRAFT_177423 [Meira miltonrushii]PWN38146.1 hypothetical protein FA14DRAFT_177423 [Meira miltonrushii]